MSKVILLNKRPEGKPVLEDFKFVEEENPVAAAGQVLLKTRYVSVDPSLRGRMGVAKSYIASFELNKPIRSDLISEVMESRHPDFAAGDFVLGQLDWREYQLSSGQDL